MTYHESHTYVIIIYDAVATRLFYHDVEEALGHRRYVVQSRPRR